MTSANARTALLTALLSTGLLAACDGESPPEPETTSAEQTQSTGGEAPGAPAEWTLGGMVTAADPRAVAAGVNVLEDGGNAVDAAIAVHAVLGLVEPQSSGIGGGAFMLYYERETGEITVFDGRETAPASATADWFKPEGEVLGFIEAWQSGRSAGVPGQIALYKAAHDAEGQADWASLFREAIQLAEDGWEVSPRLAEVLANERLRQFIRLDDEGTAAADYFYPEGEPLAEGATVYNTDYGRTLRAIASQGPDAFYTGENAEAIVAALAEEPVPSTMTLEDLANYEVITREPLCGDWQSYRICSAPPPSSGGITQIMIPNLYSRLLGDETGENAQLFAFVDAMRLSYADRDHYVADGDQVDVPSDELMNPDYLDARAGDRFAPDAPATPGDPGEVLGLGPMIDMWGRDTTQDEPGTTHISVIDAEGNAVSMTATVESAFGNSRMVNGYLLNNELTDFALDPEKNGKPVANAPASGKRPRSSMSPTLIFDENGDLFMVTGSPGGNSIIAYVAKTVLAVIDWGMSAEEAVAYPNIIARGDTVGVESERPGGAEAATALREAGYTVEERQGENSGLNIIVVREDGLEGAPDPRREGVAVAVE